MWIKLSNLILNVETGARFLIYEYDNYGEPVTPYLAHEVPAGGGVYEGFPMGATVKTCLKVGPMEELEQDLYELAQIVNATGTSIKNA